MSTLKDTFSDTTPEFADFLDKHLNLSAYLNEGSSVHLLGRSDLDGFEYFHLSYEELDLYIPKFSGDTASLIQTDKSFILPNELTPAQKNTLLGTKGVYNNDNLGLEHEPIIVGDISEEVFSPAMPNCSDMPIKKAGESFKIPIEYQSLAPTILAVHEMEKQFNSCRDQFCVALTVDKRPEAACGTQRRSGAHTDGFQGERVEPKTLGEHSYIYASQNHTIFYKAAYPELMGFNATRYNIFNAMHLLTHDFRNGEKAKTAIQPRNGSLALLDCYNVHDTPTNESSTPQNRAFMRLTYTVRLFDRLGNSVNPAIPLQEYNLRNTPTHLESIDLETLENKAPEHIEP